MRLISTFFVVVTISTTVFACPGGVEPAFDRMIRDSTLIVRGQVLSETGDSQWNPQNVKQHWSDVLIERTYKGASPGGIRVSWREYLGCPRARVHKNDHGLFFLSASGSDFVLVDEESGKLAV